MKCGTPVVNFFKKRFCCAHQRYGFVFMAFFGTYISFLLRSCLFIALEQMSPDSYVCRNNSRKPSLTFTHKEVCSQDMLKWDEDTKGQIVHSIYVGEVLTMVPGAYLARRFGGKYIFGMGVFFSSLLSIVSPPTACFSSKALIVLRLVMGLLQGPIYPAASELLSQWTPANERSLLYVIVFSGIHLGSFTSMTLTALMVSKLKWDMPFYILGLVGIVWFAIWVAFCFDKPSTNPFITTAELEYLKANLPELHKDMPTPWRAIFKSKPFWTLLIAWVCHVYGLNIMLSQLAYYYIDLTNVPFVTTYYGGGLPFLFLWLTAVLVAFVSDIMVSSQIVTRTKLRRVLAILGSIIPGIGMVVISYLVEKSIIDLLLTFTIASMAISCIGLVANQLDLSPNHTPTLVALCSLFASLFASTQGLVVNLFMDGNKGPLCMPSADRNLRRKAWQNVFWVVFAILVTSTIPFAMGGGSGEVQPWDKPQETPRDRLRTLSGGEPIREKYKNFYSKYQNNRFKENSQSVV